MKKILHTLVLVIFCISWMGCPHPDPIIEPSININGSTSYIIGTLGDEISIEFTSAKEWTIQSNQSWCTISQNYGIGGTVPLTITIKENTTTNDREAKITITSETVSKVITITQKQKDALVIAKNEYTLEADATSLEFEVAMNVTKFKWGTNVDWIHLPTTFSRAMKTYKIPIEIDGNSSTSSREGLIAISLVDEDESQIIKIVQEGKLIRGLVSIVHTNWEMMVPILTGQKLSGTVNWGDGKKEDYKPNLVHQYAEEKEYNLVLDYVGAESIEIPSLVGILEIDLSKF